MFYEIRQQILMIEKNSINSVQDNVNIQSMAEKIIPDRSIVFPNREAETNDTHLEISLNTPPWVDLHKKFLTIMTTHSFFMISDPITKRIMACFIAEDRQTQTSLVHYTGYSVSTIHRYLKQMISNGLIRQISIKYQGQLTYEMERVSLMETSYETNYKQRMAGELTILKKFAMDIDQSPNVWVLLPGFVYVYTLLHRVIRFLDKYITDN